MYFMGSEDLWGSCSVLCVRLTVNAHPLGLKATTAGGMACLLSGLDGGTAAGGPGWHASAAREESPCEVGAGMSVGSAEEEGLHVSAPCSSQLLC